MTTYNLSRNSVLRRPVESALATLIRVMYQGAGLTASPRSHQQCVAHHLGLHGVAHRPPHDAARVQVHHRCRIQPALSRPDIGEVSHPLLVWTTGLEVALQMVGRDVVLKPAASIAR